jgi:uncharacterized alkaline shock family protein YloU
MSDDKNMADNQNAARADEQNRADADNAGLSIEGAGQDAARDKIRISDEVLAQIITIAAGRIPGISIPSAGVGDGIAGLLGMKGPTRGIKIDTDDNNISVDISIAVEYGHKISEVAKRLQDEIRGDLTEMTGISVTQVNVHVISLSTKEQPPVKSVKSAKQQKETGPESQEAGATQAQQTTAQAPEPAAAQSAEADN